MTKTEESIANVAQALRILVPEMTEERSLRAAIECAFAAIYISGEAQGVDVVELLELCATRPDLCDIYLMDRHDVRNN